MIYKRLVMALCITIIFITSTAVVADAKSNKPEDDVVFSILPFLSPVALMKRFVPLREYLEHSTGKSIVIESAPNFPEYLRRTVNHDYDVVYTAPHFVPITLKDGHYELLAASNNIAAHVIVGNSSMFKNIEQLAGKRIAHGPKEAFLVIIGKYLLKEKGLEGDNAPVFISYKSHNAALRAVSGGDAEAAIVGSFHLKLASDNKLKQIASTPKYPGIAILASKTLPESFRSTLAKSFISIKDTKEGRETLKKIRFPGFKKISVADYEPLKPIARDALDPNTFELLK